ASTRPEWSEDPRSAGRGRPERKPSFRLRIYFAYLARERLQLFSPNGFRNQKSDRTQRNHGAVRHTQSLGAPYVQLFTTFIRRAEMKDLAHDPAHIPESFPDAARKQQHDESGQSPKKRRHHEQHDPVLPPNN